MTADGQPDLLPDTWFMAYSGGVRKWAASLDVANHGDDNHAVRGTAEVIAVHLER